MISVTRPGGTIQQENDRPILVNKNNISTICDLSTNNSIVRNSKITMNNQENIITKETPEELSTLIRDETN